MDRITRQLVDYTTAFQLADVSGAARAAALRHLTDTVGCAIAGHFTESAQAAVRVAAGVRGDLEATVFGAGLRSSVGFAAMANTVMVRNLDWNDGMLARGGGHPSDMVSGVLAMGEAYQRSGSDVFAALILAYELLGGLGRVAEAYPRGWDQGLFMGVAVALAAGRLAGLDAAQLGQAASLAIVPSIPLLVTRRGALSMWKGAATSVAIQRGIDAVRLAAAGMTGPDEPFAGVSGVFDQVTGPFDVTLPANGDGPMVIEVSHLKHFPAEGHAQALLGVLPEIREFAAVEDIERIDVEAYRVLVNAIGSDPSCWDPHNRETADHSLPYLLAAALVDGDITLDSFRPERIADPALRPVMARVHVRENPDFTAGYRQGSAMAADPRVAVRVVRTDGAEFTCEVTYPRGHPRNPMTDADVDAKFNRACRGILTDDRRDGIRAAWTGIEDVENIATLTATLADFALTTDRSPL
jgi:2-methylcitrate dehydratase